MNEFEGMAAVVQRGIDEILSLREINTDLLATLGAIRLEADTRDRTAHESLAIIHLAAREAIRKAEEQS